MSLRKVALRVLSLGPVALVLAVAAQPDTVRVEPAFGIAGDFGTWTVTYEVGSAGLARGGSIRVQLPDTWHAAERNSANRLQATDPAGDHYVSARASRPDVRVVTEVEDESPNFLVKSDRRSIDGRRERYVFVVRVTVEQGTLSPGDTIDVVYGDTSGGSRGMRAAIVNTTPEPILVAVDRDGGGSHELLGDRPTLVSRSATARDLMVTGPSTLVAGEPAVLHVAVVDAYANPVTSYRDDVALRVVQGDVELPAAVRLDDGRGYATVPFTPRGTGVIRVEADTRDGLLQARGNPMMVFSDPPANRVYWGDLHSHTRHSWDAVGVGDAAFEYARYVSGLDFYAMTDHSSARDAEGFTRGFGPWAWEEYTAATDAHNDPGSFATLHGYEASFGAPYGHHNVFFRGAPGPLLRSTTLPEVWAALEAGQALTIPHHTGKFPLGVTGDAHDPELRRNFEIYSGHGLSEAYDPSHPLAPENVVFTNSSISAYPGFSAQDAWIDGLVLSVIAASDDHRSHPGQPHFGLAAVVASELTREAIFDGLHARRTYGTTGARILLDFRVNDTPMGGETTAEPQDPVAISAGASDGTVGRIRPSSRLPRLSVTAHGTDVIESVEVLRYSAPDGGFRVIAELAPKALDFAWSGTDGNFRDDAVYYVRLRQRGTIRGRAVMAWSSPVWVQRTAG